MNNYKSSGDVVELTAPGGGVVAGTGYQIGQLFVVAVNTAAAGESFSGQCVGVVVLPKNNTEALTEGALVYWDSGAGELTTTSTGNLLVGSAVLDALAGDTEGEIRMDGISRPNEP